MKTRAAVLHQIGLAAPYAASRPLVVEELDLDRPGQDEVLVRIRAAGLCHSDLSVINGDRPRLAIPTRWMDNDIYGHVNNVIYYSYFDTVINEYLIREGGLDIASGATIGLAIETFCQFHQPLTFPEVIDAGLRVGKLGNSSVRYEIGLFRQGHAEPAATGHFVHVFVDRQTRKPTAMPPGIRACLERLIVS